MVLLVADVPTDPFTQQLVRYVRQYGLEGRGVVRLVPKAQLVRQTLLHPRSKDKDTSSLCLQIHSASVPAKNYYSENFIIIPKMVHSPP